MKVAVVLLPKSGEYELLVNGETKCHPHFVVLSRGRVIASMLIAMASVAGVIAGMWFCVRIEASRNTTSPAPAEAKAKKHFVAAQLVERPSIVRPLDERCLRKGDVVVLRPNSFSTPKVQQIAATPNDAVVIRRFGLVESLYMTGTNGYVVIADREPTRIVRTEDITGTLVGASVK